MNVCFDWGQSKSRNVCWMDRSTWSTQLLQDIPSKLSMGRLFLPHPAHFKPVRKAWWKEHAETSLLQRLVFQISRVCSQIHALSESLQSVFEARGTLIPHHRGLTAVEMASWIGVNPILSWWLSVQVSAVRSRDSCIAWILSLSKVKVYWAHSFIHSILSQKKKADRGSM